MIGQYKLLRKIGQGGMGTVYEARQENPRRAVALKLIRARSLSDELLRRFKQESAVLGRLQHPGIAQIYEAGMAHNGKGQSVPFFAMEFVKGQTLTEFAAARKLGTRERLDLLAKVCDAVDHAHQKGVIHRDLKPANILVDESGQPKILDFGVARATDSDVQQCTMRTDIGQLIGTIPYMSPEQVGGDPNELDTRSDVYALGVIAYEMLAERMPYDLRKKMIHDAARVIREDEPAKLSSINRTLRGDVETIVVKALEKDKTRRYQSAESLASDIRRYLKDEPIAARPASTWYQLSKFGRRHKGLCAAVAAAFVLLVAGVIGTGYALGRALKAESGLTEQLAETERARAAEAVERDLAIKLKGVAESNAAAEAEARAAEAKERDLAVRLRGEAESNAAAEVKARKVAQGVTGFVTRALRSADPLGSGDRDTTIVQAMQNAVKEIDAGAFKDDPDTEAELCDTIAVILQNNARYDEAEPLFSRAMAIREGMLDPHHPDIAKSLNNLAVLYYTLGEYDEAEPLCLRALEIREKALGPDDLDVAETLNTLGQIYEAQRERRKAEPIFKRALAIREKVLGPDRREVAESLTSLSQVYVQKRQSTEAEPLLTRAVAILEKALGPDDPGVAEGLSNLAQYYSSHRQYNAAESLFTRSLAIYEKAVGPDHPLVAQGLINLAALYKAQGKRVQAEELYKRSMAIWEKASRADHPEVAKSLESMAGILRKQRHYDDAETLYKRALAINEKAYGPDSLWVADTLNSMAGLYRAQNQIDKLEPLYERVVKIREGALKSGHPRVSVVGPWNSLAGLYKAQGRYEESAAVYERALAYFEKKHGADHPNVARGLENLAAVYRMMGRASEAELLEERAKKIRALAR